MSLASSAGAAYLSSVVTREGTRRHKRWSPGFPTEEQKHWPGDVCGAGPSSWCGRSRKPLIGSWQPALNPEMPLTPWQRYYLHLTGSRGRGGISHGAWDNQKCELGEDGPQTGGTEDGKRRTTSCDSGPDSPPKPSDPRAGTAPRSAPPQPAGTSRWHPRTIGHPSLAPLSERSPKTWAPSAWCSVSPAPNVTD